MVKAGVEHEYEVSAEKLWSVVGDFGGLATWMPGITACRVEGEGAADAGGNAKRIVDVADGSVTIETLESYVPTERRYRYAIVKAKMLDESWQYVSDFVVSELADGRSKINWSATFKLPAGIPEMFAPKAAEQVEGMYSACLKNLAKVLSA